MLLTLFLSPDNLNIPVVTDRVKNQLPKFSDFQKESKTLPEHPGREIEDRKDHSPAQDPNGVIR